MRTRLNKFLSLCGVAARRKSDILIQNGEVSVNGVLEIKPQTLINPDKDIVMCNGQILAPQIFEYYSNKFANLPLQIIVAPEYCESNNHKFAMLSDRRDDLWGHLTDNKIQALLHYTDNFAKSYGSKKQYPMTDKFCQQIITLPNHPWLTDSEIEIIADTVKQYYQN